MAKSVKRVKMFPVFEKNDNNQNIVFFETLFSSDLKFAN